MELNITSPKNNWTIIPPEFPIEFGNALVWGLAAELATEYGLPMGEVQYFEAKAEHKIQIMLDYDVENASLIIAMDARP